MHFLRAINNNQSVNGDPKTKKELHISNNIAKIHMSHIMNSRHLVFVDL